MGDVGASQQRFRDPECFISDQKADRYEEKDFAVNRDKDAMASAVLDLQQDDAVSGIPALQHLHLNVTRIMHTAQWSRSLRHDIPYKAPQMACTIRKIIVMCMLVCLLKDSDSKSVLHRLAWHHSKGDFIGIHASVDISKCSQMKRLRPENEGQRMAAPPSSTRQGFIRSG